MVFLSVFPSVFPCFSICLSIYLPWYLFYCMSVCLSMCPDVWLSSCLYFCLSFYVFVLLSAFLSIFSSWLTVYLSYFLPGISKIILIKYLHGVGKKGIGMKLSIYLTNTSPHLSIYLIIYLVSVISYCLISPCSQLEKYRYLSSMEMMISVMTPGISGRIHPST